MPSSGNGAFGGGGGGGGGGFFSGLGGKPSAENANKNVFGSTTFGTATSAGGSTTGKFTSIDLEFLLGRILIDKVYVK